MSGFRAPVVAVLAVAFTIGGATDALACSCSAGPGGPSLENWEGAVVAKLVDVEITDARNPDSGEGESPHGVDGETADFHYRIKRAYKGRHRLERGEILTIRSTTSGASCGLPRREQRRYGLLLYRRADRWEANLCTVVSPRELRKAARERADDRRRAEAGRACRA